MNKRIRTRSIVILAITALSIVLFAGFPPSLAGLRKNIRLGLDLKGGTQLVLKVRVEEALRATTDQTVQAIQAALQKDNISVRQITRTADDKFEARGIDPARDGDFRNLISGTYPEWDLTSGQGDVPNTYNLTMKARAAEEYKVAAVDQALRTIENRINSKGVTEPV